MNALSDRHQSVSPGRVSGIRTIESLLDPTAIVASLVLAVAIMGPGFDKHYLLVAFIAFSVNFPGRPFLSSADRVPASAIFLDWAIFAANLFFFGYVTDFIRDFRVEAILVWLIVAPIAVVAARAAVKFLLCRPSTLGWRQRTAVVVGWNTAGIRLAANFETRPLMGIRCLGFFDDRSRERLKGIDQRQLLGDFSALPAYVQTAHIDHIYLALPMASQPRVLKILQGLRDTTASIFFVPDIFVTDLIQGRVDILGGMPVFAVRDTPLSGINRIAKRLLDIVLTLLLLLALSPVLVLCVVLVRLSSPGPVIFRQRRYGLDGKPITVYKFRTMTVTEDGDSQYTQVVRNDTRVTRVGLRLRQLSLDELPQLINVLQGHMSLVGPRPHAVAVNEQYRRLIPDYMARHKVKPGITGWAQVNGYRGGDDIESMTKRIDYDLEYLRGWSVGLDVLILIRTFRVLLGRDSQAF